MLELFKMKPLSEAPTEFLMEMLEVHDEISEKTDVNELVKLKKQIGEMMDTEKEKLGRTLEVKNGKPNDGKTAAEALARLKYLRRLDDLVKSKIPVDRL
jgi:hypothetical protein